MSEPMPEHAPSSPAAPTPPTNAAARQSDLGGFRGWNNPSRFIIEIEILLERLASETARADRAEQELDRESAAHLVTIDDRDTAQDALAEAHRALGGDGEWVAKLYPNEPGESGDLRKDVPVIAAEIFAEAKSCQERLEIAEADLQRKDAALELCKNLIINADDFLHLTYRIDSDKKRQEIGGGILTKMREARKLAEAALAPISVPAAPEVTRPTTPEEAAQCKDCGRENPVWFAENDVWNAVFPERVGFICPICFIKRADDVIPNTGWKLVPEQLTALSPSPCCANPNLVVKGVCDVNDLLHLEDECSSIFNWRPTHNVCLNCRKEEKI